MKHILATLTVLSAIAFTAPSADAYDGCNQQRIVSYTTCGRPVYAVYQIYGHDRCGNPIGRWVTQSSRCGCSVCNPRPVYQPNCDQGHGHSHGSNQSGYQYPRRSVGFSFSFGR
jgi:hypothetical protein